MIEGSELWCCSSACALPAWHWGCWSPAGSLLGARVVHSRLGEGPHMCSQDLWAHPEHLWRCWGLEVSPAPPSCPSPRHWWSSVLKWMMHNWAWRYPSVFGVQNILVYEQGLCVNVLFLHAGLVPLGREALCNIIDMINFNCTSLLGK